MLDYTLRPLSDTPKSHGRVRSQFNTKYSETLKLLDRELRHLGAKQVVIEIDVRERDIRLDGQLRADARPNFPDVILSFQSKHGPLRYPCDRYSDWQDNVRAIALALEALRAVDRYGVTRRAEQYRGWQQLPPPGGVAMNENPFRDPADAIIWLCNLLGIKGSKPDIDTLMRQAEMKTHPDRGGSAEAFKVVQHARFKLKEAT